MPEAKNLLTILTQSGAYLEKQGVDMPRLSAEIIIARLLKMKRLNLYLEYNRPLFEQELAQIREAMIKRGKNRIPIEYIFNVAEFYSREFYVDERVLIPRIETELVVEEAIKCLKSLSKPSVLDIGCGSGAISLTIALENEDAKVIAADISPLALEVAQKNRTLLGANNCEIIQSDLFENLQGKKFDLIISNPPYISFEAYERLPLETLKEPKLALVAENRGVALYDRILQEAKGYLNRNGVIVFEIGFDQEDLILELFEKYEYTNAKVLKDYFGKARIAIANN